MSKLMFYVYMLNMHTHVYIAPVSILSNATNLFIIYIISIKICGI